MKKFYFIFSFLVFICGLTESSVGASTIVKAQQDGTIVSGRITASNTGEALPGVTVMVKGTSIGTATDVNGQYSIKVPDLSSSSLTVSYLGFKTQLIPVNNRTVINIDLEADQKQLEEVVVVGYGEQKRSNVTGAISSVKTQDLENKSLTRLDQVLQGQSAGVFISQNGGAPGQAPTIHIRGVGSISNTEPLWIVDGIRMGPGNHFNVDDIESVEILKDASSSAIYGAKAAHGVILVTTKRGKGKLQTNYKSSIGKRTPLKLPQLLGSADFVKFKKQSRLNAGQNPEPAWDNYEHDTDWIKAYYAGSGFLQSHDFSLSKGEDNYNFFMSLGYDDETGILIDNTYERFSGRINSDFRLTKWLKLGENVLLSRVTENPIGNFNENYTGAIPYRSIPIMPIYDDTNPYGGWGRAPIYFQGPNPVASQYQQHETRNYNRLDGNIYLEATPLQGLMLKGTLGYNYMAYLGERFHEAYNYGAFANPIASLTYSNANDESISGIFLASYDRSFANHNIKIMGGYEATQFETQHFNLIGTNFPVDVARSMNLATGTFNTTDRSNRYQARTLSQFGRLGYNYSEKYLLEANIRRDASAPIFGPKNIWGIFPSFSAGWRISEEDFFKNVPYITNLKLRASTGKLGSDNIGSFIYLKTYTSQFDSYSFDASGKNKVAGFFISKFPNEEVKWEEVNMHNIGLDISSFQNKLRFSVDYYIKDTKDLLYAAPIPASVGIAVHNFNPVNPQLNIGSLRNTGFDIELGYATTLNKFDINVSGNTSFMKNEMKSLREGAYIIGGYGGELLGGMTRTQAGMPLSSFYGYSVQQMLNSEFDVYAINTYAPDGIYQEGGTGAGDFMYKDISGPDGVPDGQITEHDRIFLGNPWPKMTYAMNLSLVYNKMFDISLQFQGVQGVDVFNANKAYTRNFFGDNNTTTDIYDAWTPEKHTQHPRNIANDPNGNFSKPSDYFIEDGSYLKLRNAQIGFNVPTQYLDKVKIQGVRLYVNANNLLTFTKYSGLDPEVAGSNTGRGIDYGMYPQVRTLSGGLEVKF